MTNNKDTDLIERLNVAVKAADEVQAQVGAANAELISRSKAVGLLLLEAKKLHPKVKDFDAFIQQVHGLQLSRAYDLLRLAGGRTTDEELKKDARERKQKSRAKKKATLQPKPVPQPLPKPKDSVTVTETRHDALREFKFACDTWIPKMSEEDRAKALSYCSVKCNVIITTKKAA